ncbi:hypothetical protein [Streptomyces sp. NPDC053048]|uniref:hypothetical protein n=1 Tax=Streptomyces sp. NPDC053048 TaxID=3365694 RepID=UPI0037D8A811
MALPKKGSRRIVVDGVPYRWRVRGRPTYDQGMGWSPLTYAVEKAESPGTMLVVRTSQTHPSNWLDRQTTSVLPSHVATAIQNARTQGWIPEAPGSPYILDQSQGFVPTP